MKSVARFASVSRSSGRSPCGERGLKCTRSPGRKRTALPSLPVRGAWIEMAQGYPQAVCWRSLPVRGAWIEITHETSSGLPPCGRSPCGERGLKFAMCVSDVQTFQRRSPCGERGLKSEQLRRSFAGAGRSPCGERGLKFVLRRVHPLPEGRSPCGERGLKSRHDGGHAAGCASLPVRGAWIEMSRERTATLLYIVAPRAGSVD